jgi:hypothetical protein
MLPLAVTSAVAAPAILAPEISCIAPVVGLPAAERPDRTFGFHMRDLVGAGVLIGAEKGLFLVRAARAARPLSSPPAKPTPDACPTWATSRERGF